MLRRGLCVALLVCGWPLGASAAVTMSPNPLDAGNVLLGQTGMATGTLSSTENVRVNLELTNNCSGTGAGTFALSATQNINLKNPVQITVSYTPSTRGTRQCQVVVREDGDTLGSFNVRGTGLAPQSMSIQGTATFGSVRWNDAAPDHTVTRPFTVTNGGDVSLTITNVAVTGDFAISVGGTSATILPMNSRTWFITFDPNAPGGAKTGALTFTSNAPQNGTQTVNLSGTATNAVISVNDAAFGIVNIGSSASQDLTITNSGGTPKGPLGVSSATIAGGNGWFSFAGCGGGTSCNFLPDLSINNTAVVGVKCTPPMTAAAADMETATVTFTSDTDSTTDNVATLTCTAGKSSLATNLNTLQFPPALVGTTTTPVMFTVTNTGNVNATFYLERTGANQSAFTATTTTGCGTSSSNQCTVMPLGSETINITVTPSFEGDVSAGLTLVSNATPNPQLTLTGRGIDRHIELVESVQFPDTFRNPGDMATIMPVTIKNIGEYPLQVSAIALEGSPNWQLVEQPTSFEIGGLSSHDVLVAFQPVTAGKAPDATLAVMSDDRTSPLLNVVLSGNGKDRNVAMGPGALDFGNTGAGVPVIYSSLKPADQWLTVINQDQFEFEIREIKFDVPDVFRVEALGGGSVGGTALPAGASQQFELVFLPPEVGEYTANMTLYLDQDPLGQRTVQVTGRALFVDARGGGGFGCSTGHGTGAGMVLVLAALLRRKRWRA